MAFPASESYSESPGRTYRVGGWMSGKRFAKITWLRGIVSADESAEHLCQPAGIVAGNVALDKEQKSDIIDHAVMRVLKNLWR